ncbi:hypothetical protein [Lysinibacillus pakistanensis]|uniref:DUF1963 domain-containing protein n=1 Tax=Lysinibacillus pakistanensis TaxID=759811 RepID=A0AAX3WSF8_9BACI|nr:hypothetical protein [Lysinibacillus pakistanensis]MDM5234106.1 hypothetical protein [Lysinibacillus pakistanensis]WHY44707.1 hypothetical protein QNH22_15400 [Lysinibacillus pakistanensis]WHY49713.1 hypothetical protein QNH24_15365 [Lysinibacillus pakistanensis]
MRDLKILKERTECMLFQANEKDSDNGWIGGNAPAYFDELEGMVNKETEMNFYLSIVNPFNETEMISIFAPKHFEERISKNRYPNCSLITMKHPKTEESKLDTFADPDLVKHFISEANIVSDKASFEERFLIKFGGTPRHIQGEEYYYNKLHDAGFDFIFQVDEDGYPDTLIKPRKNYPFSFGAIYLYAQILEDSIMNPIHSYWQFS